MHCPNRPTCFDKSGIRRRILASSCYPAFYRGHQRVETPEFYSMMRLRKIWAEGSFAVLKRENCISKIRKRGISAAAEECLLAVMALNLKRMVRAIFNKLKIQFMWAEEVLPRPSFFFLSTGPHLGTTRFFVVYENLATLFFFPNQKNCKKHLKERIEKNDSINKN